MTRARIAVVGSGLAGTSAAWRLARAGHAVTLFERQAVPGFTAANVVVEGTDGAPVRVDVPLRVFYPGYYPTLVALYRELGVDSEPVDYAATITDADGRVRLRYRNLRLAGRSWAVLPPADLLRSRAVRQVAAGWLRLLREAPRDLADGTSADEDLATYLARRGHAPAFVDGLLLPAIATICTCTTAQARAFPAPVVLDYLTRGVAHEPVRRVRDGADAVQRRLLAEVPDVRLAARLAAVRRGPGAVVSVQHEDGRREAFDHLLFATQAPQALRLLADADDAERRLLQAFRCTPVEVVTHRDASRLPAPRADWSPVMLRLDAGQDAPESTIWVNAVQPALRDAPPVFQTVNPHRPVAADAVLGRARFERPVVDAGSSAALASLAVLQSDPARRVWFCGSWAQAGIPLLESAVRSAALAVDAIEAAVAGPSPPAEAPALRAVAR